MLEPAPFRPVPPSSPKPSSLADDRLASARVVALLDRARSRQRRLLHYSGAFLAASVLFLGVPPALCFAASSHRLARPLASLVPILSLLAFVCWGLLRSRRQVGDRLATARLLALRLDVPVLVRGLLPAVELSEELERGDGRVLPYSRALALAHLGTVAAACEKVDLEKALPGRPARHAGFAALAGAVVFLVSLVLLRGPMTRGAWFLLERTRAAKAHAATEPITGEIELTFTYPAHTRLAPRTVPSTNGEIVAPRGTQVSLKTRADRELSRAFVVEGETALPLAVAHRRDLAGGLIVQKPGSYRFRFQDDKGRVIAEGPPIPIAVEEDAAPRASIAAPLSELEVDPHAQVPVRFEAEDDYGLSEVALLFKLPGTGKPQRVVLRRSADGPRRVAGEHAWELAAHGLLAGDRVAYYLEATDNDTVSGKKTGVSRTQYLKVYSEAEHHRQILERIEEKWEALILLLADRLESPDRNTAGRTAEKILAQAVIDAKAQSLAADLKDLARAIAKEKAPDQLRRALRNVAQGLSEKAAATSDARGTLAVLLTRGSPLEGLPTRRLEQAVSAEIAEEEKDVLYLETLLDHQRIKDLMTLTRELAGKRRELASLLEQYRIAPDEATKERIEREIGRLKERMAELMERMRELSRGINDEHMNAEALKELSKDREMMSSFDKIQALLNEGKVEEAMKELEKLGQMMDKLEKNLRKASGEYQGGDFGELGRELSELAKDLDSLKDGQEDLLKDTQEVRGSYKKALSERLAHKGADFVNKLRLKAERAKLKLSEVDLDVDPFTGEELKAAREEVENLDRALAVQDFDQASQSATKSVRHALRVADDLERQVAEVQRYQQYVNRDAAALRKSARSAQQSVQPLEEVKRELERLFPSASEILSEDDRQKLRRQGERQGELHQRSQRLGQRMEELGKKAPIFSPGAQQMMRQAGQRMQRAQDQLSSRNPSGAVAEERAALDQLTQLRKGLEQQGKGESGGGPGVPWPWLGPGEQGGEEGGDGASGNQKVQIPGADQYQVPEEYRKDILDAMKQQPPERYKDQVKRYYEEIVK